jgi:hypothetical protein
VEMIPEAFDSLTGEEKSRVYRMLRLEVTPTTDGYDVSGAICTSVTPSAPGRSSTKRPDLRFHVLLTEPGTEQLEFVKA